MAGYCRKQLKTFSSVVALFLILHDIGLVKAQSYNFYPSCKGDEGPFSFNPTDFSATTQQQGPPGKRGPAGPKGEQGQKGEVGSDSLQQEIQQLRRKNKLTMNKLEAAELKVSELESQISGMQLFKTQVEDVLKINKKYAIRRTPRKGNWDQARQMCKDMGGDLLQYTIRSSNVSGVNYKREIEAIIEANPSPPGSWGVFIGAHNRGTDGKFVYLNGDPFYGHQNLINDDLLYTWDEGQPQAREEVVGIRVHNHRLHDFGMHEIFYGLCEIEE